MALDVSWKASLHIIFMLTYIKKSYSEFTDPTLLRDSTWLSGLTKEAFIPGIKNSYLCLFPGAWPFLMKTTIMMVSFSFLNSFVFSLFFSFISLPVSRVADSCVSPLAPHAQWLARGIIPSRMLAPRRERQRILHRFYALPTRGRRIISTKPQQQSLWLREREPAAASATLLR